MKNDLQESYIFVEFSYRELFWGVRYALAIDLTARDVQLTAKKAGLPWSVAKGYDTFCPVSGFIPKDDIADPDTVELWLTVGNELRQK